METIEIDDEVFVYLQGESTWGETSPNETLRRLLGIDNAKPRQSPGPIPSNDTRTRGRRKKGRKADLSVLIRAGILREGQKLYLHDYQGNRLGDYAAVVSGKGLLWKGQQFSMSKLASIYFQQEGYTNTSFRGPMYWCTEDGVSVLDLWHQYRRGKHQKGSEPSFG